MPAQTATRESIAVTHVITSHRMGKFNEQTAQTSSDACTDCDVGKYSLAGQGACTDCGAGKFNEQTAQSSSDACTDCGAGKLNEQTAQTSSDACTDCDVGKYSLAGQGSCWRGYLVAWDGWGAG